MFLPLITGPAAFGTIAAIVVFVRLRQRYGLFAATALACVAGWIMSIVLFVALFVAFSPRGRQTVALLEVLPSAAGLKAMLMSWLILGLPLLGLLLNVFSKR